MCDVVQATDAQIAALAGAQDGAVSRAQLRRAGIGRGAIEHRIERDRLHPEHRGVYLVGHTASPERAHYTTAVVACGDAGYLSHGSALEDYGAIEPNGGDVHVTVIAGRRRSRAGIRVHFTRRADPRDFGTRDGLRITSPARAALDYAEYATPRQLAYAVNQLHVLKLATPEDLYDVLHRTPGRRGAPLLKATLARHDGPTRYRSGGERILFALIKRARLRVPEVNAQAEGKEIDLLYRDVRLAIELDGGHSHGIPKAVDDDRRKDAYLRSRGYEVLRYSYWQIEEEPEAVIAEISAALQRRRQRPNDRA